MRFGLLALVAIAWLGCKDKQPQQKPSPTEARPTVERKDRPRLEPTESAGPGFVPVTRLAATVTFDKREVMVDGEPVITVADDGTLPRERLESLTRKLEETVKSDDPLGITFDATTPYVRVGELLGALKRAGFRNIALLAGAGNNRMIPLELPDSSEINSATFRPIVTITGGTLKLWSASGEEGTKQKPKLTLSLTATASLKPLTDALVEIVARRWGTSARGPNDKTIIIQMGPTEIVDQLMRVLAAVRSTGTLELFPSILLAGGV